MTEELQNDDEMIRNARRDGRREAIRDIAGYLVGSTAEYTGL